MDIVRFSRGAATTLDFCHLRQGRGGRKPGSDAIVEANPEIRSDDRELNGDRQGMATMADWE